MISFWPLNSPEKQVLLWLHITDEETEVGGMKWPDLWAAGSQISSKGHLGLTTTPLFYNVQM